MLVQSWFEYLGNFSVVSPTIFSELIVFGYISIYVFICIFYLSSSGTDSVEIMERNCKNVEFEKEVDPNSSEMPSINHEFLQLKNETKYEILHDDADKEAHIKQVDAIFIER